MCLKFRTNFPYKLHPIEYYYLDDSFSNNDRGVVCIAEFIRNVCKGLLNVDLGVHHTACGLVSLKIFQFKGGWIEIYKVN